MAEEEIEWETFMESSSMDDQPNLKDSTRNAAHESIDPSSTANPSHQEKVPEILKENVKSLNKAINKPKKKMYMTVEPWTCSDMDVKPQNAEAEADDRILHSHKGACTNVTEKSHITTSPLKEEEDMNMMCGDTQLFLFASVAEPSNTSRGIVEIGNSKISCEAPPSLLPFTVAKADSCDQNLAKVPVSAKEVANELRNSLEHLFSGNCNLPSMPSLLIDKNKSNFEFITDHTNYSFICSQIQLFNDSVCEILGMEVPVETNQSDIADDVSCGSQNLFDDIDNEILCKTIIESPLHQRIQEVIAPGHKNIDVDNIDKNNFCLFSQDFRDDFSSSIHVNNNIIKVGSKGDVDGKEMTDKLCTRPDEKENFPLINAFEIFHKALETMDDPIMSVTDPDPNHKKAFCDMVVMDELVWESKDSTKEDVEQKIATDFSTGSGKQVLVSGSALNHGTGIFNDISMEEIVGKKVPTAFMTGRGNQVWVSKDALHQGKKAFDSIATNETVVSDCPKESNVELEAHRTEKIKEWQEKQNFDCVSVNRKNPYDSVTSSKSSDPSDSVQNVCSSSNSLIQSKSNINTCTVTDVQACNKQTVPTFFTTGRGKKVLVSEDALKHGRKTFEMISMKEAGEQAKDIPIHETRANTTDDSKGKKHKPFALRKRTSTNANTEFCPPFKKPKTAEQLSTVGEVSSNLASNSMRTNTFDQMNSSSWTKLPDAVDDIIANVELDAL